MGPTVPFGGVGPETSVAVTPPKPETDTAGVTPLVLAVEESVCTTVNWSPAVTTVGPALMLLVSVGAFMNWTKSRA